MPTYHLPKTRHTSPGQNGKRCKKNIKEAIQAYLEETKNSKVAKSKYPILTTINA
ncbi:protein of unknown function [Candidatus Nitrosotalea okcheonensis]|uniref:Uncharacterized protein n=1 Tax=Candidatus Nitrosotalea okcheonensis TaxID=1903276 RepID=A0A2H1FBQ7_9ARCH|nr:protein of unknown function [Candidatus Nitrosotalea okcheonensis]